MNKSELKKFVRKVLLEKLDCKPNVHGKLIKKTISFRGINRECVAEGTIEDANLYAHENNLQYINSDDSYFGGHFISEMTSYEFQPDPEFYGEIMETNMTAREQLARICGSNDQILTEVDASNAENLVEFICTSEEFKSNYTDIVFENIKESINNKLHDKSQFKKLFSYLVEQSIKSSTEDEFNMSETEVNYATEVLSKRFFKEHSSSTEKASESIETKCGKKSFKEGNAFENMQRIVSNHRIFL